MIVSINQFGQFAGANLKESVVTCKIQPAEMRISAWLLALPGASVEPTATVSFRSTMRSPGLDGVCMEEG